MDFLGRTKPLSINAGKEWIRKHAYKPLWIPVQDLKTLHTFLCVRADVYDLNWINWFTDVVLANAKAIVYNADYSAEQIFIMLQFAPTCILICPESLE